MKFALGPGARSAGLRLNAHDTIGSTNAQALTLARDGDPGDIWVVSNHQTEGRGRRGRRWSTEPGNLAASILVVVDVGAEQAATLGFVAGLSLDRALMQLAPGFAADRREGDDGRLGLKWPNDVLVDGHKVAGILLEAQHLPGDRMAVAVGIGVNIISAPMNLPYPASTLRDMGIAADAATVFAPLADAWAGLFDLWDLGAGFPAIRELWLQRAAGLGGEVAVRAGRQVFSGVFETIDDSGRLLVRAPDGSHHAVSSGEAHFGTVATAR
ncbi:MAG: biotin--[acetyl-CoA-carboxylase] ligase [Hyphomicrobiales bacterium]|nr:biotin--[acetyl-CoA-carboxylase] ligase [Hyphomicrobiales bacterium]